MVVVDAPSFVLTHLLGYVRVRCVRVCVGDDVAVGSRPRWRSVMWHLRWAASGAFGGRGRGGSLGWATWSKGTSRVWGGGFRHRRAYLGLVWAVTWHIVWAVDNGEVSCGGLDSPGVRVFAFTLAGVVGGWSSFAAIKEAVDGAQVGGG